MAGVSVLILGTTGSISVSTGVGVDGMAAGGGPAFIIRHSGVMCRMDFMAAEPDRLSALMYMPTTICITNGRAWHSAPWGDRAWVIIPGLWRTGRAMFFSVMNGATGPIVREPGLMTESSIGAGSNSSEERCGPAISNSHGALQRHILAASAAVVFVVDSAVAAGFAEADANCNYLAIIGFLIPRNRVKFA